MNKHNWGKILYTAMTYILVAALASALTLLFLRPADSKLNELAAVIEANFVGDADMEAAKDAAAAAMVEAIGDKWSYYIPAEEYAAFTNRKNNTYVGIGITVENRQSGEGVQITAVSAGSPAEEAGVLAGDILLRVDELAAADINSAAIDRIADGPDGSEVTLHILRGAQEQSIRVKRKTIRTTVATGQMLDGKIGYVRIYNFNTNCADETLAWVKSLQEQGAEKFLFDVRYNGGGYVSEMLEILDYLLPEGVLFQDIDHRGVESKEYSDAACLDVPMAVLVNGSTYSAAEFFAAALSEYEWATVVGEQTTGKGHYQNTFRLSDGSAVNLSTGKYFTPKGVNLTEAGGITPEISVAVDYETALKIYNKTLPVTEDPQILAAVGKLNG